LLPVSRYGGAGSHKGKKFPAVQRPIVHGGNAPTSIGYRSDNRVTCRRIAYLMFILFHKPSVHIVIVKIQYIFADAVILLHVGSAEYCSRYGQ
ncbi:hypothetical protein RCM24_04820, partial [Escherichia coli]|nr:hypothetical protein [Escherichia coli]